MLDNKLGRKRFNTQIMTKTEVALQAIKKHDMQQSRINFHILHSNDTKTLLNQLDYDYTRLTPHKALNLDRNYKISLFTYSEQYYSLQMVNYIFPMRVVIKNVRNQGTIYIGYDQPYPGICHNGNLSIFQNQSSQKQRNYDFKSVINQDIIIILKNKGNKLIKNIYFTIIAGKSLFLCDFKVQFLGFVRDERLMSQVKLKNSNPRVITTKQKNKGEMSMPILQRLRTQPRNQSNAKQFVRSKLIARQISERPIKLDQFNLLHTLQMIKHNSRTAIQGETLKRAHTNKFESLQTNNKTNTLNKNKSLSAGGFKIDQKASKTQIDYKIDEVKKNKEIIEIYRLKDKELKQTASKCKRMIQNYKKIFNEENVRKRRLNKDIVIILYSAIFIKHARFLTIQSDKKQNNKFRLGYLCNKFVRKLKKSYQETCNMVYYRLKRSAIEEHSGICMLTKVIAKHSYFRAQKLLKQSFDFLHPLLLVRHSISVSNNYRNSIKFIQRAWKQKYHNRIYCLLYFVDNHIQKMFRQFPHLKIFHQSFYISKTNRRICLDYIKDQSQKYRYIYQAYLHRLQEINQIKSINQKMELEKSTKKRLDVPRKSNRPVHRFYRNLDILRSMVRTWFEIQYKKYTKKSSKKILY